MRGSHGLLDRSPMRARIILLLLSQGLFGLPHLRLFSQRADGLVAPQAHGAVGRLSGGKERTIISVQQARDACLVIHILSVHTSAI